MNDSTSIIIITFISISIIAFIYSFGVWTQHKKEFLKSVSERQARLDSYTTQDPNDKLSHLLEKNFRILDQYYTENLRQYSANSYLGTILAALGFGVVIISVTVAIIGNKIALGSISTALGIILDASAFLVFKQNRLFRDQMINSLNKIVSMQYLMISIAFAKELANDIKKEEIQKTNEHLRILIDFLHGIVPKK